MTKALLASTALAAIMAATLLATTSISRAADLAATPVEPIAPVVTPFDWTGPYIGLHAGYGWGREHDDLSENGVVPTTPVVTTAVTLADHFSLSGFVGGAHAGYNYQFANQFVIGVEGDLDYTDLNGSHRFTIPAPGGKLKFNTDWQASARLRAGYAIDNVLLYATGGVAFSGAEMKVNGFSDRNTHVGWTVGAGAEYAFTQNWIGRAEVRYSDFNKKSYDTPTGKVKADFNQTTATLGISYKF